MSRPEPRPSRTRALALVLYPLLLLGGALAAVLASLAGARRRPPGQEPPAPTAQASHHQPEGWLTGITRLSLHRRPAVFLGALVVALICVYSAFHIQQELFPDVK